MKGILIYQPTSKSAPLADFIDGLDPRLREKILLRLYFLTQLEKPEMKEPHFKRFSIERYRDLWELRVKSKVLIAVETHQPESDAVAIPSEVHVLPLKLFPANRASQLRHIFQCPIFAHISTSHISVRYCASDSRHPARRDIRPCCPARPLIENFAAHASILCRTSARRHASHSLPPSSMRQFSGAATIAHAVSGVMLSIISSKASCIPQASQI